MENTRLQAAGAVRIEGAQTARIRLLRSRPAEEFYPSKAKEEGLDGLVVVDVLINAEGLVLEAKVLFESPPDKGFGLAALDVAKTYEFDNPLGKLVLMSMTVQFQP